MSVSLNLGCLDGDVLFLFCAVLVLQGQNVPANSSEEDEFGTQGVARGKLVQSGPVRSRYHAMGHS